MTTDMKAAIENVSEYLEPHSEDITTVLALAEIGRLAVEERRRVGAEFSTGTSEANGAAVDDFHAIDQSTGEVVWKTRLASQVTGYPITYEVDGRQYVAVTAGGPFIVGDQWAAVTSAPVDAPSGSNAIYVFALPAAN